MTHLDLTREPGEAFRYVARAYRCAGMHCVGLMTHPDASNWGRGRRGRFARNMGQGRSYLNNLSYLAEVPIACKEKTRALLGYLLSVEGQDEASPFYSICFLLPWLCQITMHINGCKALASAGGHREIVECLVNMVGSNGQIVNDKDTVFLACDTIMNLLLNRKELKDWIEWSDFVNLLHALIFWNENCKEPSVMMMVSSICCLVLDLTSEESLLNQSSFDRSSLEKLSHLIARSLNQSELTEYLKDHSDLHQIIIAGYYDWADRFPSVRNAVENS